MVNSTLPANAEGNSEESFVSRMTRLYIELNTIGERVGEMPDDAMNLITEAASIVCAAVVEAPVETQSDVASKLRFVALLVENPHGVLCIEDEAARTAVSQLIAFRAAEWASMRAGCAS